MPPRPTVVYPIPGYYIEGVPAVPTECPTKKDAEELVATGAFSYERPAEVAATEEPAPMEPDTLETIDAAAGGEEA